MTIYFIALLVAIGFVFLIIELLLIPGFSVPGIVGIAMIGYGIFKAHAEYGTAGAAIAFLTSAAAAVILVRIALKSRAARSVRLDYDERGTTAIDDYTGLVGMEGRALSNLRPSGTALIGNKRIDVVTDGEYISKDMAIRVQAVDGTRIIVIQSERG
ncbi:MAG: hypothetical protein JXB48_23225 [Candidatus Latescibacteria bacterium]|nr:hypothetical protein [Candidatus Latescibacterota bacterium]